MKKPMVYPCRCDDDKPASKRWCAYIQFLHEWADNHSDCKFYGMTPPSFGEFMDNEYGN